MTATAERSATDQAAISHAIREHEDGDGNDPSVPTAAYMRMKPRWERCRDCMIGTEAIRDGGQKYLPQHEAESPKRYEVRRNLAAFFNGYARTVAASVGLLLKDEPTLSEDMPDEIRRLWENIDAAGTHGSVFTRRLATAGIVDSHAGILVEHSRSPAPGRLSGDEERRLGLRPYFLLFRADDVLKPVYESVNGVKTLVLLILREVATVRVGRFGLGRRIQYRVYTNEGGVVRYELWRNAESGGRPERVDGPHLVTNQTQIPWAPFVAGEEIRPGEYRPPLLDLADMNLQYHVSITNHLSLQSLAYVPTPVRIGATKDERGEYPPLVLGPGNTIEAPMMDGVGKPVYWLSPPVDVLEAGERTLASTKADMATLGASFLHAETRAAETAEGKRIDSAASRATLATVSRALQDTTEMALGFMANYLRVQGGSVTFNDDFTGESVDPQYLAVVVQAYQEGALSLEELRHVIQTGQLPETFKANDLMALISEEASRRDAQGAA